MGRELFDSEDDFAALAKYTAGVVKRGVVDTTELPDLKQLNQINVSFLPSKSISTDAPSQPTQ